jgi:hypothetical protein
MGAVFSSIKPEQMTTAGLRPVMRVQPVQDTKALPVKKEEDKTGKAKEPKDTTHQTVDEIQNKFGF